MNTRNDPTCFVMTPFKEPFDSLYRKVLAPAIVHGGLKSVRGDEIHGTGLVLAQLWDAIKGATLCVADISEPNANVMYELGLAHAFGKSVVLVTRKIKKTPFDLKTFRLVDYNTAIPGWEVELSNRLVSEIASAVRDPAANSQISSQAGAVLAVAVDAAQKKEDFLSFFGRDSLATSYKAVFLDAQLPRVQECSRHFRDFASASLTPLQAELLNKVDLPSDANDPDLCLLKLGNQPRKSSGTLPKGIREIVPWQELEVVMEIDRVFQEFGGKLKIVLDRFHRGGEVWPENGGLALGLGFNNLTVELGDFSRTYQVLFSDRTDDFITFAANGRRILPSPDPGYEYALLARILVDRGRGEPTPYLVCAGHTADGTQAACHYLATKWQQLLDENREKLQHHHMTGILYHPEGQPYLAQELREVHFTPYGRQLSALKSSATNNGG